MTSIPLVSGIMIFLNGEKYIEEAIESVFAQTYDNWELLLVDDGSTDKATDIARRYAEKYPEKVRYLEHENHHNRGMSASRNLGIRNAKGEYIAFLDADDVWLPPKLEKQVAILNAQPEAAMVYGPTQVWYSWTGRPEDLKNDHQRKLGVPPDTLILPPTLLRIFLLKSGQTPATCGVLLRREVIEAVGGFEESFRGMYEDQAFFAKIALNAPVFVESGSWDRYRQHPDSSCNVALKTGEYRLAEMSASYLNYLKWLEEYLSKQGLQNPKVWLALQKEFLPVRRPNLYRMLRLVQRINYRMKKMLKILLKSHLSKVL